jgi:hypothetical protein
VVFYQMLTGELPGKHLEPPSHKVEVDVRLDEIVLRALERKPELRYQQVSEVKTCVETIVQTPAGNMPPFSEKHHRAPWSQGLVLASLLCTGACLWPAFTLFKQGGGAALLTGSLLVALTLVCALFAIRGYTITADAILIHRLFWATRLPLAGLKSARFEIAATQWAIRAGNGGFFSCTGFRYNRTLGFYRVFATDGARTVVLRYTNRTVVVSPADPEAFVRDLAMPMKAMTWDEQARVNEAEWQSPGNWTGPKWLSVYFSKRDSRAWVPKQIPALGSTVNLGNPRGAFALLAIVGAIFIALVVVPLAIFMPGHSLPIKSDYIGQSWFPGGDSIAITSVERSTNRLVVKGHYNLVSRDQATLALYCTSTNTNPHEEATQRMQLSKGRGDFELSRSHLYPGLHHVSMYADGHPFASLYFGTKAEALEESKLPPGYSLSTDDQLATKVTLTKPYPLSFEGDESNRITIQYAVIQLANQAGLDYDWNASQANAGEVCRKYITPEIKGVPLREALAKILKPEALTYDLRDGKIVLKKNFGTQTETLEESKFDLGDNQTTFGPVLERVVTGALDFDSGKTGAVPVPGDASGKDGLDRVLTNIKAFERASWDFMLDPEIPGEIFGVGMKSLPLAAASWDGLNVEQFARQITATPEQQFIDFSSATNFPATYGFQTREGGRGILQITGFTENPRGVKIRYKLVQNGKPANAASLSANATGTDATLPAIQAWLGLMDDEQYAESWRQASEGFRALVTQGDWVDKGESIRKPLGKLLSRKLEKKEPNGPFFIAKFDSSFEGLKAATETVTFALETNGQWRAASYLIVPQSSTNHAAVGPAQAWLRDIDSGHFAQSWTDAAQSFQSAISSEKWRESLQQARQPLGSLVSRKVISAQEMSSLPGAPDGRYIVMQFETSFTHKKSAVETVTFMLEKDGQWKAAGYYIR